MSVTNGLPFRPLDFGPEDTPPPAPKSPNPADQQRAAANFNAITDNLDPAPAAGYGPEDVAPPPTDFQRSEMVYEPPPAFQAIDTSGGAPTIDFGAQPNFAQPTDPGSEAYAAQASHAHPDFAVSPSRSAFSGALSVARAIPEAVVGETANLASQAGQFAGEHVTVNPIGAGMGGDVGVTTPEQREQIGQVGKVAGEQAPLIAAYAIAPEIGVPTALLDAYFAAEGVGNVKQVIDAYHSGQIDGRTAIGQLALTAPNFLPVLLHGTGLLAKAAQSPEGQAAIADARMRLAGGEAGSLKLPGEGQPPVGPGAEGANGPVTGDNLPPPATEGGTTTAPEAAVPPESSRPMGNTIDDAIANLKAVAKTGDPDATAAAVAQLEAARGVRDTAQNIPAIEAQSKPLTVEQRAAVPRDTAQAFFKPSTTNEVTVTAIKSDMDIYQRIQNQIQKVPGLKSVGTYIEPVGAAKGQEALGNSIPMAMVKRDLTIGRQSSEARAGLLSWAGGKDGQALGLDPNGIARAVEVKPGANIPKDIAQRLDDVVEHPESYNLTPEQQAAIVPIQHTLDAVTQHAQQAGVDVNEVSGPYFPRKITAVPNGDVGAGGGIGSRLTSKPGFAKMRVFPDTRSAVEAGYSVASPIEALGDRLVSGVKATANKEAFGNILDLGVKPSTRIPEATTNALLEARTAYKAARSSGDPRAIELAAGELAAAKRGLRKAGLRAATPMMGETKAYGRIFPQSVVNELNKYGDVSGQGVVDQFFNLQRATETTGDHSSLLVQGGNLLYRNPVAWLKSAAYSTVAAAREPWGWVSRNMAAIDAAVKDGAATPPAEFLLQHGITSGEFGPKLTRPITRAAMTPMRAAQRMFEWNIFMGQVEWHKAALRMDMTAAERQELGSVIRKGMGSSSMPGVTNAMRNFDKRLWYAGGFMRSTLGLMVDASRAGIRGEEARKTLGMVIGGATAATIGLQFAIDGTLPNLTNPNRTDKRWGYVEFPGGGVNLYGPLFPYIRLVGKAGQDVQQGNIGTPGDLMGGAPNSATGELGSLISGKFALPIRTAIDLRRGETFTGDKIAPGWKGTLEYLARQSQPLGIRQATEGGIEQFKQFPEQGLETIGGRTTPNSDYQTAHRALIAAGVQGGLETGDLGEIADARANNPDVAKALDAYQFTDYLIHQKAQEAEQKAGLPNADSVFHLPEIQDTFKSMGLDPSGYKKLKDYKAAYVKKFAPAIAANDGVSLPEGETRAGNYFEAQPAVQAFNAGMHNAELYFWQQNRKLLDDMVRVGALTPTQEEQRIIDEYRRTKQIAGNGKVPVTP